MDMLFDLRPQHGISMATRRDLPPEVFRLAFLLMPEIDKIFGSSKLSPVGLFILMHINYSGKTYKDGRKVMLRDEMTTLLHQFFKYQPKDVSVIVGKFKENKYLEDIRLTKSEKKDLYGSESGRRDALALDEAGLAKINEFSGRVNELYNRLTSNMPDTAYYLFNKALNKFGAIALKKVHSTKQVT